MMSETVESPPTPTDPANASQEPEPAPGDEPDPPEGHIDDRSIRRAGRDITEAGRDATVINNSRFFIENIRASVGFEKTSAALQGETVYTADPAIIEREIAHLTPPPRAGEHLRALEDQQVLVLTGDPETGLTTAARLRWWTFAQSRSWSQPPFLPSPDEIDGIRSAVLGLDEPGVLLVDLSDSPELGSALPDRLIDLQGAARKRSCHLVIALQSEYHRAAARKLPDAVFRLERPDPRNVLRSLLDESSMPVGLLGHSKIGELIADAWPPRIKRLAEIIRDTEPGQDLDGFVSLVGNQFENWSADLRTQFAEHGAEERTLLLSAAMTEGTTLEDIARAADEFAASAGFRTEVPQLLELPSLWARFEPLQDLFDRTTSKFTKPSYGKAVLEYAWREFPDWRDPLQRWFDFLLGSLPDDGLSVATERLLELSRSVKSPSLITNRVSAMVTGDPRRRTPGAILLVAAATDPGIGREVRRRLWHWSANAQSIPVALRSTVAEACGHRAYYSQFPLNAITRLRHLSKSEDRGVREQAMASMVTIGASDWGNLRGLLEQLGDWIVATEKPEARTVVVEVVTVITAKLLQDERLVERLRRATWILDNDPKNQIGTFWRLLFAVATPGQVRDAVQGWLRAAAQVPLPTGGIMADYLVDAATGDFRAMGQLRQAVGINVPDGLPDRERFEALNLHIQHRIDSEVQRQWTH